jgi:hypothetical protein
LLIEHQPAEFSVQSLQQSIQKLSSEAVLELPEGSEKDKSVSIQD